MVEKFTWKQKILKTEVKMENIPRGERPRLININYLLKRKIMLTDINREVLERKYSVQKFHRNEIKDKRCDKFLIERDLKTKRWRIKNRMGITGW
jgi:hypothetical protein